MMSISPSVAGFSHQIQKTVEFGQGSLGLDHQVIAGFIAQVIPVLGPNFGLGRVRIYPVEHPVDIHDIDAKECHQIN